MKKKSIKRLIKVASAALIVSLALTVTGGFKYSAFAATEGFKIVNGKLIDANGNEFIMRGINEAHNWYQYQDETAVKGIANTGANTIRFVLSDGEKYSKDNISKVKKLISLAEENKLVSILEVHDATGSNDYSSLEKAAKYWIEIKDALKGHEDTVILNIANEWYGSWESKAWAEGYEKVIPMLRDAGIKNTIMVDCSGYGQYPKSIADKGVEVFKSDKDANTMFSMHLYEYAGGTSYQVKSNIDNATREGLAVCVGEFGYKHKDGDVDEETIIKHCAENGIGWLAWSWYGNSGGVEYLDLVRSPEGGSYTEFGDILFNKLNAMSTSKICSVFNSSDKPVVNPTEPSNPGEVVKPVEPQKPAEPEKPVEPQKPANTKLSLKAEVTQYYGSHRLDVTIKNNSDLVQNGWKLKIKKSDLAIQSMWSASYKEEGEYYIVTPESWTSRIEAGGSVSFGLIAQGNGTGVFDYILE
ncbi:MAG: glycoside hydrolase family 5 protein [Clostridium sp.]|jgi:hypothetical protein|nr:glycoside hydrolase family 5 protein [Clostridium sp.]